MQHQAYQPLLPAGNKYLQQKWDKASYDLHRTKVKSAQPTINTTTPRTFGHLALKLKKRKLEEEWATKIQRENAMLREKIAHIMKTSGAVDNRNVYRTKSLSREKRQKELIRITEENQTILSRLTQCRSRYDRLSWHQDWLRTLKVMDSIARYPRGGVNQQKGEEKLSSDRDQEQKSKKNKGHVKSETNNKTEDKAAKASSSEEEAEK
ncbi:unnamed protein product [Ophioblennius macclurei]